MHSMEGRETKGPPPPPSADLFVCFPSRVSHLSLIPKPICSPARSSEPNNRHLLHRYYHLKRSSNRGVGAGQASPLLWAKTKSMSKEIDEPTSPRVNCAGKIKVRTTKESSSSSCKKWESSAAMEEMEKLHHNRKLHKKEKKKKKNAIQEFFPCLTRIRVFHFRCFGSFSAAELPSDDEGAADDHELGDYGENQLVQSGQCGAEIDKINVGTIEGSHDDDGDNEISRTVFSKWFMILQEDVQRDQAQKEEELVVVPPPPPNALLLMRCRSAPAKSRLEARSDQDEKEGGANEQDKHDQKERDVEEEEAEAEEEEGEEEEEEKKGKLGMDEEERRGKRLGVVMRYDIDLCKFSSNIANETWVVGDVRNPLPKSRSWRR